MASPLAIRAKIFRVGGGLIALIGMSIAPVYADVGVTSATDGDPLGRPPSAAERVLRVGIDIQANEAITTKENDRAHIVFLDGTSLTVAPNAQLVIDKYVYDPNTKTGDIAVSVSKGVLRLVGGRISKNTPMVVNTPAATIGIRGGIGVIVADHDKTQGYFLFGTSLSMTANGVTKTAYRPNSVIETILGRVPGAPSIIPPGGLTSQMAALEGRTATTDRKADDAAKGSGFSSANSGQTLAVAPRSLNLGAANNVAAQAVSNSNVERQPLDNTGGTLSFINATPQLLPASPTPPVVPGVTPPVVTPPVVPVVTLPVVTPPVVPVVTLPVVTPPVGPVVTPPVVTPPVVPVVTPPVVTPPVVPVVTPPVVTPPVVPVVTPPVVTPPVVTPPVVVPPVVTPPITRGATPAIGVGNGGLVHAIPPPQARR